MAAGPGRIVSAPALLATLQGAGPSSVSRAVCEPLDPDDLPPIEDDPEEPLLDRAVNVMTRVWEQAIETAPSDALRLAALNLNYHATMGSLLTDWNRAERYLTAAGMSYSNYVRDYFKGYLDLLLGAFHAAKAVGECDLALAEVTVAVILGEDDVDFDALLVQVADECGFLLPILQAADAVRRFYLKLDDDPLLVLGAGLEVAAETAVLLVEKFADADLIGLLEKYVEDEVAIGELHGTLIGIVIAEIVIDELLTLGAGKAIRGMRTLRRVTP